MVTTQLFDQDESIDKAVELLIDSDRAIFIGRGNSAPLAEEGALKMGSFLPAVWHIREEN